MVGAFVLHSRPFRNTSAIAEFITDTGERVPAVARGVRGNSRRAREWMAALQPFRLLQVSFAGRGELKTLVSLEQEGDYVPTGQALYAALYLNELTLRLLHRFDPHPPLWQLYRHSVEQLTSGGPLEPEPREPKPREPKPREPKTLEPVLRYYELGLLEQLGYGLSFDGDADSGEPFRAGARYRFLPEHGFVAVGKGHPTPGLVLFSGEELLALKGQPWPSQPWSESSLKTLKRVCRLALAPLLGDTPLKSRELFAGSSGKTSGDDRS